MKVQCLIQKFTSYCIAPDLKMFKQERLTRSSKIFPECFLPRGLCFSRKILPLGRRAFDYLKNSLGLCQKGGMLVLGTD